jgi:Fe2+ transport system protein B
MLQLQKIFVVSLIVFKPQTVIFKSFHVISASLFSGPAQFIDSTFASLHQQINELPAGVLTNLVSRNHTRHLWNSDFHSTNCLLVSIYFPLEESGYMSRVVFLNKIMRISVLSGKV